MGIDVRTNSAWHDVSSASARINGSWHTIKEGYQRRNGAWEKVWPTSGFILLDYTDDNPYGWGPSSSTYNYYYYRTGVGAYMSSHEYQRRDDDWCRIYTDTDNADALPDDISMYHQLKVTTTVTSSQIDRSYYTEALTQFSLQYRTSSSDSSGTYLTEYNVGSGTHRSRWGAEFVDYGMNEDGYAYFIYDLQNQFTIKPYQLRLGNGFVTYEEYNNYDGDYDWTTYQCPLTVTKMELIY